MSIGEYSLEDDDQLQLEDTLIDRGVDDKCSLASSIRQIHNPPMSSLWDRSHGGQRI
jgi:hypothetical protein